jgi:hypothetical protein
MRGLIAGLILAVAGGANAVTIGTGAGQVGVGGSFTLAFNGIVEGSVVAGLTSQMTFTVNSIDATTNTIGLTYSITNTSADPITASRVSAFGFDSSPDIASATVTGLFTEEHYNLNFPQLNAITSSGIIEFCANNNGGNSCGGGGSSGVLIGDTGGGTLQLRLASSISSGVDLTGFVVRYQSIAGTNLGNSGIGVSAPPIPEPSAMAVFGLGSLIVGAALRRSARR